MSSSTLCSRCISVRLDPSKSTGRFSRWLRPERRGSEAPSRCARIGCSVTDVLPDLPLLRSSAEDGCEVCNFLREVILSLVRWDFGLRHALEDGAGGGPSRDPAGEVHLTLGEWLLDAAFPYWILGTIRIRRYQQNIRFRVEEEKQGPDVTRIRRPDPLSEQSLGFIRDWLGLCLDPNQHPNCPKSRARPAPLRLLDVMADDRVRLVEGQGRHVQYAILSYCWGPSSAQQAARTLRSNLDQRRGGFPISSLPPTLRDSVVFTRHLGIRYIWIDALCIVQDGTEWQTEAARMMQYYAGAYVTIAPIMCSSADEPFLRRPDFPSVSVRDHAFVGRPGTAVRLHLHYPVQGLYGEINRSCWSGRGWTFQEKLLSSRVIYLGENGISAKCRGGEFDYRRNSGSIGRRNGDAVEEEFLVAPDAPQPVFGHWGSIRGARSVWYTVLSRYIERQLKLESDRLIAFSGVVQRFGQLFRTLGADTEYVAGLWKDDLWNGLCWSTWVGIGHNVLNIGPKSTSLPSWSWCSMKRPVIWPDQTGSIPLADLISLDESTKDRNSLESLEQISLVIRSWVFPFEALGTQLPAGFEVVVTMDDGLSLDDDDSKRLRLRAVSLTAYLLDGSDEVRWKDSPVSQLHELTGLILEPADGSEDGMKTYRRIGIFEVRPETLEYEGGAVESTFYGHVYSSRDVIKLV